MVKKSGGVGTATLVSRILGFVRDAVIAMMFGATFYSDAFFVAFRIPDILRKFFSDGVMGISFVPVFTGYLYKQGKQEAFAMARSAFFLISFFAGFVVIAGIVFAPLVVKFIAPGFSPDSYEFALIVLLSRIMMPYIFCISLMALCMGILNSMGHFTAPAAAPIIMNLVVIFFGLVVSPFCKLPVAALSFGVVTGGVLQLAWQLHFVIVCGVNFFKKSIIVHPGAIRAGKMLIPSITGASAYQINLLITTVMASTLCEGSISYIYYADRLVQFPLALFAVSISTVLLPELSKKVLSENINEASRLFVQGVKLVMFITIPSMAGLALLREPIVTLLFCQGAFDPAAVKETGSTLLFFTSGLWAFAGTRLFVTLFYAFSDVKTPFKAGVAAIGANMFFSFFLIKSMGHQGLALSISIAAIINFLLLLVSALSILSSNLWKTILLSGCRTLFLSGIMYLVVDFTASSIMGMAGMGVYGEDKVILLAKAALCVLVGILVYAGSSMVMKNPEMKIIKTMVIEKSRTKRQSRKEHD
ncbi:MAG: murein biosynthesis integral membrane protein MurJ [Thermodesulfobacteriota bacterium]|nr:murein biosynthesis integral membrane protein MurJ [Thermodesulfobacteriota bacterium]